MTDESCAPKADEAAGGYPGDAMDVGYGPMRWTESMSVELQKVVEDLFAGSRANGVIRMELSLSIADPALPDCPLVGVSEGFTRLTQYTLEEMVGVSCRKLLSSVPPDLIDERMRTLSREFCKAAAQGLEYQVPEDYREKWLPPGLVPMGELWCVQTNAKKDGTLFKNMFYLKQIELNDRPLIVGLQGEMNWEDYCRMSTGEEEELRKLLKEVQEKLETNMNLVERELAKQFQYTSAMRRQI